MKKFVLNPLFAPFCVILYMGVFFLYCLNKTAQGIFDFVDGPFDVITYGGYLGGGLMILCFYKDYKTPFQKRSYFLFLFLLVCAVLREAGIQHWIPSQDSTAFKIRFFTNPANPIGEKILSLFILATVCGVVVYLLIKYVPAIIRGFFKLNPVYWTVCTFGGMGIISKFADRFPSNYWKSTGVQLDPMVHAWVELFEETGEATLPLLFALGVVQFHLMQKGYQKIKSPKK